MQCACCMSLFQKSNIYSIILRTNIYYGHKHRFRNIAKKYVHAGGESCTRKKYFPQLYFKRNIEKAFTDYIFKQQDTGGQENKIKEEEEEGGEEERRIRRGEGRRRMRIRRGERKEYVILMN